MQEVQAEVFAENHFLLLEYKATCTSLQNKLMVNFSHPFPLHPVPWFRGWVLGFRGSVEVSV